MPSKTGLIYHDAYLLHDTGYSHPERPDRLRSIVQHLHQAGLWAQLQHPIIDRAGEEWILKVHTARHWKFVKESCARGVEILDRGDTHVCPESYDVALLAVGGVLAGVDALMKGELDNVFCAVRPPGHHAETDTVMGFCLFNNVAVAARYAQVRYGVENVAIVDWDVHHGNGTQEIFYSDPTVFYISTHQFPFYPGTGARTEIGEGKGKGYTLNCPMRAGSGDTEYMNAFAREIIPALERYKPDLLIISAGFDAHKDDPLANINLTEETFGRLTQMMMEIADKHCGGRLLSVLEGGYNLEALARSVEIHVRTMLKDVRTP
jgi:acetoin utilization deacetylase AcuC-like enzyme